MDSTVKMELIRWALYIGIPAFVGWLGHMLGKSKAIDPALREYEKYLPIAEKVVQTAEVLNQGTEQEKKAKATAIIQDKLQIPERAADYLAQKAYVILKDAIDKATKK